MRLPIIQGIIDRRILVNYRVTPEMIAKVLPEPFRPKLVNGYAIAGICLIRLKSIRPRVLPAFVGISSENAAHRIAVEWDVHGETQEGVFIPRRDTSSRLNVFAGGRIFPGVHHFAKFTVDESEEYYSLKMQSDDDKANIEVTGRKTDSLHSDSIFNSLAEVSDFFEAGSLGYSVTQEEGRYDGLELACKDWKVSSLDVDSVRSSFFEDESIFPKDSVTFDCALLMHDISHQWHSREDICCPSSAN